MFKFVTFLALIVLCCLQSSAQPRPLFGVKVGITFADEHFDHSWFFASKQRIPGFAVAAFAEWFNTTHFSLISQVELTQRGTIVDVYSTEDDGGGRRVGLYDVHNHLHYLSASFLPKWSFSENRFVPYLFLGPRLDFLLWHSSDYQFFDGMDTEFKNPIVGGSAGIGWNSGSVLPITFVAEIRYNFDILLASRPSNDSRNDAIDFWIGYAF